MMTTPTGATGRMSLSTAAHEITVTGVLPKGDTTGTVTYFIVDTANNIVVGQVVLPNAVKTEHFSFTDCEGPECQRVLCDRHFRREGFYALEFSERTQPHQ